MQMSWSSHNEWCIVDVHCLKLGTSSLLFNVWNDCLVLLLTPPFHPPPHTHMYTRAHTYMHTTFVVHVHIL